MGVVAAGAAAVGIEFAAPAPRGLARLSRGADRRAPRSLRPGESTSRPGVARIVRADPASRISLHQPRVTAASACPERVGTISVLRNLEQRIESLVEGVFSRAFSSQVQPVEIARKLAKEMDAHRTASVSRVYVPNQYTVWLSTEDRKRLEGYERSLEQELSSYLLEHARRHDYALLTRPEVDLESDERLRLGEFGIQTRLVKPPARQGEAPEQGEQGHTMVYSVPPKDTKSRKRHGPAAHLTETKAIVSLDDRRYVLDGPDRGPRPLARVRLRAQRPERLPPPRRAAPRDRPATGRSSTSARPTASRSTAAGSTPPASAPATRSSSAPSGSSSTSSSSGH